MTGVVAGVIDGDTITVQSGFLSWTVRYLGVDTPETNVVPEHHGDVPRKQAD